MFDEGGILDEGFELDQQSSGQIQQLQQQVAQLEGELEDCN